MTRGRNRGPIVVPISCNALRRDATIACRNMLRKHCKNGGLGEILGRNLLQVVTPSFYMGCKGSQVRILSPRPIKSIACEMAKSPKTARGTPRGTLRAGFGFLSDLCRSDDRSPIKPRYHLKPG